MSKHEKEKGKRSKSRMTSNTEKLNEYIEIKESEKNKKKTILKIIFFILFLSIFIFSITNLIRWFIYNQKASNLSEEIIETTFNEEIKNENDINENPVDFETLKKQNPDTVAWIKIEGTTINYPIVQSTDNDYYLHKDFNKEYSTCGWIFMDYKNSEKMIDKNTVLYGHNIKSGIMFADLQKILRNQLGNEVIIEIYTPVEKLNYRVFSSYLKEPDDYATKSNIVDDDVQEKYIKEMLKRSDTLYNLVPDKSDRLLTLSTCDSTGENRILIHSVYIGGESYTN